MEQSAPEHHRGRAANSLVCATQRKSPWANHGKPWDRKAMGTKVSYQAIRTRCYVSPAAGKFSNPFERAVTQSQEAKLPREISPAGNTLVRPPDTLHP